MEVTTIMEFTFDIARNEECYTQISEAGRSTQVSPLQSRSDFRGESSYGDFLLNSISVKCPVVPLFVH